MKQSLKTKYLNSPKKTSQIIEKNTQTQLIHTQSWNNFYLHLNLDPTLTRTSLYLTGLTPNLTSAMNLIFCADSRRSHDLLMSYVSCCCAASSPLSSSADPHVDLKPAEASQPDRGLSQNTKIEGRRGGMKIAPIYPATGSPDRVTFRGFACIEPLKGTVQHKIKTTRFSSSL